MPLFTVIIPTYNRLHLLKETLASVQAQTFTDYEIIVVDDGSTDGTWDYLQTLAPAIRSLRQENKGPGAARNLGAQHATGTYIAFLDSDDLWFPWTLATFHTLILKHNHPALLCGKTHLFQHPAELTTITSPPLQAAYHPSILHSTELLLAIGAGITCIQRTLFLQAGGYNPSLHAAEDHDFALRIALAPGYVQIHSPPTLAYRRHSQNITQNPQKLLQGIRHLITSEKNKLYPGGTAYKKKRIHFITQHTIPATVHLLRSGHLLPALTLYLTTLPWAITAQRWKYILGFPIVFLFSILHSPNPSQNK